MDAAALAEQTLAGGVRDLRFPAQLEGLYEAETAAARKRDLTRWLWIGIITFSMFIPIDHIMLADIVPEALLVRFAVTVIGLAQIALLTRDISPRWREASVVVASALPAAGLIVLLRTSQSEYAHYYYAGLGLAVAFTNIGLRLRFRTAVVWTVVLLVASVATFIDTALPLLLSVAFVLTANAVITLFANYRLEYDDRVTYLHALMNRARRVELAQHNVALVRLSAIDPLTGLANRRSIDAYLDRLVAQAPQPLAAIMVDVDFFKDYNDTHGHAEGDECLARIASILADGLRGNEDLLARYGGEEFLALLPGATLDDALAVAERFHAAVLAADIPHTSSTVAGIVTISAGVASGTTDGDHRRLIRQADDAMYLAKRSGRNQVRSASVAELDLGFGTMTPESAP